MARPPEESKKRALIRVLIEMGAQFTAATAAVAHLLRFTHPTAYEQALAAWRNQIADEVEDQEERLRRLEDLLLPRLQIGAIAISLATWLVVNSRVGLSEIVEFDLAAQALPAASKADLEEACFELQHMHLIRTTQTVGSTISTIIIEYSLYWTFDQFARNTNPVGDAKIIAQLLLQRPDLGSIPLLDEAIGWPRRRFNPALALVLPHLPQRSNEVSSEYPVFYVRVDAEARYRLGRLIASI